ncbi:EF-hand domain-containing protein [Pseudoxanthomonas sp.]|uniref:EF-hand domain-containing protein n=1 Tax=Pseudoxanthomonas sp. TaxID=1871049 RepID=UPI003F7FC390
MKNIPASALLFLSLLAAPAFVQDHGSHAGHGAQPAAKKADANTDQAFDRLDRNRDGFVSKAELPERHPLLPHFGMGDKNRDGKLDRKEFASVMAML